MSAMMRAALELAAAGWSVFPCQWEGPDGKAPLTMHGHHDASREPEQIRRWWDRWPLAMIGASVPDSLLVFDIDPRNGGSLTALEQVLGVLPATLSARSGRGDGGGHLYFLRPHGTLSSTALPAGIDLKRSGYMIMPPSLHPATGEPYRWHDVTAAPAALPQQARAVLRPAQRRQYVNPAPAGDGVGLIRHVATAAPGDRNKCLFWAACRAYEDNLPVLDQLRAAAVATGLHEAEIERTIVSASRTIGVNA
ncbi:bifunctional DNA primase/polymerase [Microbacterium sp.]|uniref:bifunctional DNA primase/polymerase n=1 Tax=Microbacterium sp. TaxID=51671 RepID=UPI003F9A197F